MPSLPDHAAFAIGSSSSPNHGLPSMASRPRFIFFLISTSLMQGLDRDDTTCSLHRFECWRLVGVNRIPSA
jgi:hypothetical protein